MDLQDTLKQYVKQLENHPRTLKAVISVCRCIMATLYDAYFPGAAAHRPGPASRCPDSDILTLAWLGELVGKDSERAWHNVAKPILATYSYISLSVHVSIADAETCVSQARNSAKHSWHFCHKQKCLSLILFLCRCVISNVPMVLNRPSRMLMLPADRQLTDMLPPRDWDAFWVSEDI